MAADKKKGCFSRLVTIFVILMILGFVIDLFDGPKIKGDTAYVNMDLYLRGAAKNKEWGEKVWEAVQQEEVETVIIRAKAQYADKYGKSKTYKEELDMTELISPFSEVRQYTKSKFASEFGDYIVFWVSERMGDIAAKENK